MVQDLVKAPKLRVQASPRPGREFFPAQGRAVETRCGHLHRRRRWKAEGFKLFVDGKDIHGGSFGLGQLPRIGSVARW